MIKSVHNILGFHLAAWPTLLLLLALPLSASAQLYGPYMSNAGIRQAVADSPGTVSGNTHLTGFVVQTNGRTVYDPFAMKVYRGGKLLGTQIVNQRGLFSFNLYGKAKPGDVITIVIPAQRSGDFVYEEKRVKVVLSQGQNLTIKADYKVKRPFYHPFTRGTSTNYINEI